MHLLIGFRCSCRRSLRAFTGRRQYVDFVFPWERSRLPELLVSESSHFKSKEYAILDGVLDDNDAVHVREEIRKLKDTSMTPNCTFVWDPKTRKNLLFRKSQILEYDYYSVSLSKGPRENRKDNQTPLLDALSKDMLLSRMVNVIWGSKILLSHYDDIYIEDQNNILEHQALKLQYNKGNGGCFPIHYDSDPSVDSRFLTCILYLNDRQDIQGGELELYPQDSDPVQIDALFNRMVLFKSQSMAHRVLPSYSERFCLTLWCSASPVGVHKGARHEKNIRDMIQMVVSESDEHKKQRLKRNLIEQPSIRRHLLKFRHRENWRKSIEESHDPSQENNRILELFDQEIKTIERVLGPILSLA